MGTGFSTPGTTTATLVEHALHKLRQHRLEEAQPPFFISPMAKASLQARDDDLFPLREKVQEFLTSKRQVMLILGDSGAGKSTFIQYLERQLWMAYQSGDPIPLFINLPLIYRPDNELIVKHLRTNNFSDEQIQEMKQHRRVVLICDGYDESQLDNNLHTKNLLNQPGQWNVKMVISCRTQYLGQNYRDRFMPGGVSHYLSLGLDLFQEAIIAPFTKEQIKDYVEQYVSLKPRTWTTNDYLDKLTTIPNLMDLVRNPFLLFLSLEALPGVTEGQQDLSAIRIRRIQLYDTFVRHWFVVNNNRLLQNALSEEDRSALIELSDSGFISMGTEYATNLASAIFEHQGGNPIVQYVHIKDKMTWKAEFFGPDPKAKLLRESCPLTRTGTQFRFLHRSMLEYFFSLAVFAPSNHSDQDEFAPQVDVISFSHIMSEGNSILFKHSLLTEPPVIQFLCERVKQHPCLGKQLLAIIEQSKSDTNAATAAANSITILVRAGVRFNSADLRRIQIPGADLSEGEFDYAQFQGADLRGVSFARSWLRQADFSYAQMSDSRFGELPYLQEQAAVNAVAFSPNGILFAVALRYGSLTTYNTTTWTRVRQHKERSEVSTIAFSPNSRYLSFVSEDMTCRLWDTVSGETLLVMEGHTEPLLSVAFSPCGKQIASTSYDSTIRLWNSETGECLFVLEGHENTVLSAVYSADGQRLISGSDDGSVREWDPETGTLVADWAIPYVGAWRMVPSVDRRQCAVLTGPWSNEIHLLDVTTGEHGPVLHGDVGQPTDVAFSPNGEFIASSSEDKTVRLWDSSSGQLISRLSGHSFGITTCTFSSDSLKIASGDLHGIIRLWEVSTNWSTPNTQELTAKVRTAAYFDDGLSIISDHDGNTIQCWDPSNGASRPIPLPSPCDVESVALSPNGHWLANGCINGDIRLLNVRTGIVEHVLFGPSNHAIVDMSFSHCGRWLVSCNDNWVIRLWDLDSTDDQGKVVGEKFELYLPRGYVVFSPVGDQFVVGLASELNHSSRLRHFDPRAADLRQPLKESRLSDKLRSMDYSPDGQRLILGTKGSVVLIRNLQSDKPDVKLEGHTGAVCSVAYSPCSKWIISGSDDRTFRLWSGEIDSWFCVATVDRCLEAVTCIAWNPVVPLEFLTGSADGSVRVWRILSTKAGEVSVRMCWGSNIGQLCAADLTFKCAVGLSSLSQRLLVQRYADDGLGSQERDDISR